MTQHNNGAGGGVSAGCSASRCSSGYLKLIYGNPTVTGETLEHGHQELETTRPVTDQEHHTDQIEDAHENAGHVQKLKTKRELLLCSILTFSSLIETQQSLGKP